MVIDIALFLLAFLIAIPAVTGYLAYSHGKSFWLWFTLSCFLPLLSNLLFMFLYGKSMNQPPRPATIKLSGDEDAYMHQQIREVFFRQKD